MANLYSHQEKALKRKKITSISGCAGAWFSDERTFNTGTTLATNGQTIDAWNDTIANYSAAQASGTLRPLWTDNIFPSGAPGVTFDGTDDYLMVDGGAFPNLPEGTDVPFTLFLLQRPRTATGVRTALSFTSGASNNPLIYLGLDTGVHSTFRRDDSAAGSVQFSFTTNHPVANASQISTLRQNGTTADAWVDGLPRATIASDVGVMNFNRFGIGAAVRATPSNFYHGDIGAVIYFNRALTDAEVLEVHEYLAYYGGTLIGGANKYFVSSTGSDSNSGTSYVRPYLNLSTALTALGSNAGTIYVNSTESSPIVNVSTPVLSSAANVSIEPYYGAFFAEGADTLTSGWAGGPVYSKTVTPTSSSVVVVTTLTAADGGFVRLISNTSTPTTPAAGEYGFSGTTLYVRLPGDANPNSHTIKLARAGGMLVHIGTGKLTIKGCTARYYGFSPVWSGRNAGDAAGGNVVAIACKGQYTTAGFATLENFQTYELHSCVGEYNYNDGFNWHGAIGNQGTVKLYNCRGAKNADEGTSAHENVRHTIKGGEYFQNGSGGTTNIDDTVNVIEDALFYENLQNPADLSLDGAVAFFGSTPTATIRNCIIRDNLGSGIKAASGITVVVENTQSGTINGNLLPDVY